MKLFQPQLLLVQGKNDNFFLHATTYTDRINLVAKGQDIPSIPNKKGVLKIKLKAIQVENLAEVNVKYLNPIVHLIDLGNLEDNGVKEIQTSLYIEYPTKSTSKSSKPKIRKQGSRSTTRPKPGIRTRPNSKTT